jgi:ribonuclease BN (tRNA processing enzyme)
MRTLAALVLSLCCAAAEAGSVHCGKTGVWLQILGSGGPEIDDKRASASYLLWVDDRSTLLVDPAPGSALRFEEAGGRFEELDAIALSQITADHAGDLAAFIRGSVHIERKRQLPVLGPEGGAGGIGLVPFLARLIGADGAFPDLASFLTFRKDHYKLSPVEVPSTGSRRWSRFGTENVRLSSIPVHHGDTPTVAWRAESGGRSITFGGDFNNEGNLMQAFARNSDALVVHHAIGDSARGELRSQFATPAQIGRIAAESGTRMLVLGHRMQRTRGIESQTEASIRQHYGNALVFADDLECWGL